MRAILFASATATRIWAFAPAFRPTTDRWSAAPTRPADDRHGAGDQETPEIALAHLGYLAQPRLAAGAVLARHQALSVTAQKCAPIRCIQLVRR